MKALTTVLLLPFTLLTVLWHSLVLFVLILKLVWEMVRKFHKERYL